MRSITHPWLIPLNPEQCRISPSSFQQSLLLGTGRGCLLLGRICRSRGFQLYSHFSGLYADSVTQEVPEDDGSTHPVSSALVSVQGSDSLFQFTERLLHTSDVNRGVLPPAICLPWSV